MSMSKKGLRFVLCIQKLALWVYTIVGSFKIFFPLPMYVY